MYPAILQLLPLLYPCHCTAFLKCRSFRFHSSLTVSTSFLHCIGTPPFLHFTGSISGSRSRCPRPPPPVTPQCPVVAGAEAPLGRRGGHPAGVARFRPPPEVHSVVCGCGGRPGAAGGGQRNGGSRHRGGGAPRSLCAPAGVRLCRQ